MKYIKPPDFKSVKQLGEAYKRIEQDITDLLVNDASAKTANELNQKIELALSAAILYLAIINKRYTDNELATAFKEGQDSVNEGKKLSNAEVSAILEKQGFKYAKNGFSRDTYIELQNATKSAGNGLKKRVNSIIGNLSKTGQDSVYNVQQAILKDLQEHNVLEIEYSNGAKMSLTAYAMMAARSARIESTNIGAIGSALQSGTDLVIMTTMPQCCKLCGAYQDKVYSISGKDKRFPALFKTVLKNGYALPHPNCRHEFIPWYEEMEAPEDVEKAIKRSKIKYDKKGELVDVRYQRDIKAYQEWQAGNRQLNRELHEFEQMQAYYESKGLEAPYKSLASFRRARRSNNLSPTFKAWRYRNRDAAQYERWKKELGAENIPKSLDSFQKIKYTNSKQYQLMQQELAMRVESKIQPKLSNYEQAKIPKDKTYGYLLNPDSEVGKHKARVIKSALGYEQDDYEEFSNKIFKNLPYYKAEKKPATEYGEKFVVRMILTGKNGNRLLVDTVWQIDNETDKPRIITMTFP